MQRTRHAFGGLDERTLQGQGLTALCFMLAACRDDEICKPLGVRERPAYATASVIAFMHKMYYSVSESMPTRPPIAFLLSLRHLVPSFPVGI